MKARPRLDDMAFEQLASQTRMGAKAREMARLTLVEGHSMQAVALRLDTIPQRVRLAVGSIQRVQASLTWGSAAAPSAALPEHLARPLRELIAEFHALARDPVDDGVLADLQRLLNQARQRIARRHRSPANASGRR